METDAVLLVVVALDEEKKSTSEVTIQEIFCKRKPYFVYCVEKS